VPQSKRAIFNILAISFSAPPAQEEKEYKYVIFFPVLITLISLFALHKTQKP
jgi:hypothetical protein